MSTDATQTTTLGIVLGGILGVAGIGAYAASDFASATALIPTVFGVALVALAVIGRDERRHQLAVYGIGALSVLGILGSLRGVPEIIALLTGGQVESVVAPLTQGLLIGCCLILVGSVGRDALENR